MKCKKVLSLIALYLDNRLDVRESSQLEAHLQNCSACRNAAKEAERCMHLLQNLPRKEMPEGLADAIAAKVRDCSRRNASPFPGIPFLKPLVPLAILCIVVIVVYKMKDINDLGAPLLQRPAPLSSGQSLPQRGSVPAIQPVTAASPAPWHDDILKIERVIASPVQRETTRSEVFLGSREEAQTRELRVVAEKLERLDTACIRMDAALREVIQRRAMRYEEIRIIKRRHLAEESDSGLIEAGKGRELTAYEKSCIADENNDRKLLFTLYAHILGEKQSNVSLDVQLLVKEMLAVFHDAVSSESDSY